MSNYNSYSILELEFQFCLGSTNKMNFDLELSDRGTEKGCRESLLLEEIKAKFWSRPCQSGDSFPGHVRVYAHSVSDRGRVS